METKGKQLSFMQIKAIEAFIRNGGRNKASALTEAGYSMAVVRQPHKVFGSHLVREELEKRGFALAVKKGVERDAGIRLVERPYYDFANRPKEWLEQLKDMLEKAPGAPLDLRKKEEETTTYVPTGIGDDIFSVEAKENITFKPSNLSSM